MQQHTYLVITSIAGSDNKVLRDYAEKTKEKGIAFVVIGDTKSPADFELDGCSFYSIEKQRALQLELVKYLPEKHYARKNVGYLQAIKAGAEVIIETDDDNLAYDDFWDDRTKEVEARLYNNEGWLNVYKLFSDKNIWPRGFSLEHIQKTVSNPPTEQICNCPIQQGLADENPDVDALYRLIEPLPVVFNKLKNVALGKNTWCPFNSQNTTWFKEAFPLLYLPSYCSFRMTDIWRSFIAQRICRENDWTVLFHKATVWQERNEHNLMHDFSDELSGYLNNHIITKNLEQLNLLRGIENIPQNLMACYEMLVNMKLVGKEELPILEAWLKDLSDIEKAVRK